MAKVTIILEVGDQVVDSAVATMPDAALRMAIDAIAVAYGWTPKIANPDFDPNQEESVDNQREIENMTKDRHFSFQLRKFAEHHTFAYATTSARQQAESAANQAVAKLANAIHVE